MSFIRCGTWDMSSSKRKTIFGVLNATGLPVVLGGMFLVAFVTLALGAGLLLRRGGEMAFPTIVAEYFWIGVWAFLAALVVLGFGWIVFFFLARRFARPIAALAGAAERAATAHDASPLDEGQDLDELHRLAVSFNRLLADRDRKADELRNISRNALHDLRSPLAEIYDTADNLAHDLVSREEAAVRIRRVSRSLVRVIEMNAEISRNYSGTDQTPAQKIDLAELIRDVGDIYAALSEEKKLALDIRVPNESVFFTGHETKLRRLVGNLLDNAIKYTSEGSVVLTLSRTKEAIEIEVEDTGCGIPVAEQQTIYERFYRGALTKNLPGTGLGLSLVHSIVSFYGGTITCTSEEGQGTSFRVSFS